MLEKMKIEMEELKHSEKKGKSILKSIRYPLSIYRLIYYYMKEEGTTDRTEAVCDLIHYGFSYYSEKMGD